MSSLSEESLQESTKQDKVVLSPGWFALSKAPQEAKGVEEKLKGTEHPSSSLGVAHLSSTKTSLPCRHRYSKAELEVYSARAKLPINCIESSLEVLGNLRRLEKSPFVKPKNGPSFDSSPIFSNSWQRGSFLSAGDGREPSPNFRHFPRKEDLSRKKQHKQSEVSRTHDTKSRYNRNQKPYSGSKRLLSEVWYYRDPQNDIQGPFSLIQLKQWLEAGYYDGTLPICESGSDSFQSLESVLKAVKIHDTPPGIGKKRDDAVEKDNAVSSGETRPQVGKFDSMTNECQQSTKEKDEVSNNSSMMSQNEPQKEDQAVLCGLSSSKTKEGLTSLDNSNLQKLSNEKDSTDLHSQVERVQQEQSHELEDQTCHLIFGNDISASVESETRNGQENFPLERDIAELERDLVSNLDLDSGAYSFDTNFASFPESSLTVGQWQYSSRGSKDNEEMNRSQKRPMNPAEYLMSIDPAIAKASVSSKSTSPDKNLQNSNVVASNMLALEQNELFNTQSLNETSRTCLAQNVLESNASVKDSTQTNCQTVLSNKYNEAITAFNEERNNFQEAKKVNGKKKRSHIKHSSNFVETSQQQTAGDSEKVASSRRESGRKGKGEGEHQIHAISHSQGQRLSDSLNPKMEVFDNFFKAFSDSSKPAWNTWSASASNLRYPLSLREVQLEEERRQKEEALKVNKERKTDGLETKRFSPWGRQPVENAPFVEIQRREMEQQASRMKSNAHFEENRVKGRTGMSWSDKLTGSLSTRVSPRQSSLSSVEKWKDTKSANCPQSVGFWDSVDQSLESSESNVKSVTPNISTKSSVDKYESFNTFRNGSFGANIPEDLKKWCEEQFSELVSSQDVTLAEFLASLNTREEIREYAIIYLGNSKKTEDFVEEFVRRLQFEFESQKVTPGSSGSQAFKSGRRRKKS
ncbi:hypothetical protein Gasu2_24630 [Galdieria sulphuraria]|uniref:GYF domain-containing protein n=1 Tax=Galdieria sulphuraria TaxID=130081 RepID=M2X3D4_GALSU|nr:uncharacterized protein Gasu_19130 [Galdieria sulphuraria]EME30900.1 hypothetical protein Gasu_19130 [Galdieria sulphuraria]GJD08155.1 hypothetical protein Gasu2_24630 [Galdieria sulphuraria]|eukprot:XP_005707420.1 hypothetical protein Gasu_19130 [Galdieria sulphuraria]